MFEDSSETNNLRSNQSIARSAHQRYSPPGSDFKLRAENSNSFLSASLPQSSSVFHGLNSQRTQDQFNDLRDPIISLSNSSDITSSRASSTSTLSQSSSTNSTIFSSSPSAIFVLSHYLMSLLTFPLCCLRMSYTYLRTIRKILFRVMRTCIIGRTRLPNFGNSLSGSFNGFGNSFRSQLHSPKHKHNSSDFFSNKHPYSRLNSLLKRIIVATLYFFIAILFIFLLLIAFRPPVRAKVMEYFYFHNVRILDITAALEADAERRICDWKHGLSSLPAHVALESVRELLTNTSREPQVFTDLPPMNELDELSLSDQYALLHKVFLREPSHMESGAPQHFRFDSNSYASLPTCAEREPFTLRHYSRSDLRLEPIAESEFEALFERSSSLSELEAGCWRPASCRARHRLAVLVPFRERHQQLRIFLRNMHPFLMRQKLAYCIFVIEQTNDAKFNRALLFNVGFLEAMRVAAFDCVVLHDVDTIAGDERIPYRCPGVGDSSSAVHLAVAVEKYNYTLPFPRYFGGVLVVSREQFAHINGASNVYFGWGGEDDDLADRLYQFGYNISRPSFRDAVHYSLTIDHIGAPIIEDRYSLLVAARPRQGHDGLNSLRYELVRRERHRWATVITVRVCQSLCLLCDSTSPDAAAAGAAGFRATVESLLAPVPALSPSHSDSLALHHRSVDAAAAADSSRRKAGFGRGRSPVSRSQRRWREQQMDSAAFVNVFD